MTRAEQLFDLLLRDLQQDCLDYQALKRLMGCLYEALMARHASEIESLNQQVNLLLDYVRARAQRRSKILSAFNQGQPLSTQAMTQLIARSPAPWQERLGDAWQQLETQVRETKLLNERNGKLLAMHSELLSQLLGARHSQAVYQPSYY